MSVNGHRLEFVGLIIPWNDLCVDCTGLIIRSQGDFARQQIYPVSPDTMDYSHQLPNIVQRPEYFRPNISLQNDTGDQVHDPGEIELWELMTSHLQYNANARPVSHVRSISLQCIPNVRPISYI